MTRDIGVVTWSVVCELCFVTCCCTKPSLCLFSDRVYKERLVLQCGGDNL
jgi:hypothetical protein